MRYMPAVLEVAGLIACIVGAYLLTPALGLVAGGLSAVVIGYTLEDAK
jgi:hypothetical protein